MRARRFWSMRVMGRRRSCCEEPLATIRDAEYTFLKYLYSSGRAEKLNQNDITRVGAGDWRVPIFANRCGYYAQSGTSSMGRV